jgi:hypothetical protein
MKSLITALLATLALHAQAEPVLLMHAESDNGESIRVYMGFKQCLTGDAVVWESSDGKALIGCVMSLTEHRVKVMYMNGLEAEYDYGGSSANVKTTSY